MPDLTLGFEAIETIEAPALVIVADSAVVRPEDAVEPFRLPGGGACLATSPGRPRPRLAVCPGTTRVTLGRRVDRLIPTVPELLDPPAPEPE